MLTSSSNLMLVLMLPNYNFFHIPSMHNTIYLCLFVLFGILQRIHKMLAFSFVQLQVTFGIFFVTLFTVASIPLLIIEIIVRKSEMCPDCI